MTLLTGLALVGALVAIFLLRSLGLALVMFSLIVYEVWGADISGTGRFFFWLFFAISLLYTFFAGRTYARRRGGTGVGLAMLVFSIVLASDWHWSRPFDGWSGVLTTLLLVVGVVLALVLLGALLPVAIIAGVLLLLFVGVGQLIGRPNQSTTSPPSPTTPPSVTSSDEPTTDAEPTDTPSSVHLDDPEVPDEIKGSAPATEEEYWQPDMPTVDWDQDRTAIPEED